MGLTLAVEIFVSRKHAFHPGRETENTGKQANPSPAFSGVYLSSVRANAEARPGL